MIMDSTDSNVYVAELLQQLEELKRKKARRLQKLKKLKKPSSHHESVVKDVSCRSIENVSRNDGSKQDNSVSKCAKCGLCLISKGSPCIQCISAEQKENRQKESGNSVITLNVVSATPDNQAVVFPERSENAKVVKQAFKHTNLKEISNLNSIDEVQYGDVPCVLEVVQKNIISDSKENLSSELWRQQRKRSSAAESDLEEGDHKKFKLSEETLENDNNNTSMVANDTLSGKNKVSSVDDETESSVKPQSKGSADGIDESLFNDMSYFLSSSPLVENEDNIKEYIDKPMQLITESGAKSALEQNARGSIYPEDFLKDIPNSTVCKYAAKSTYSDCSENNNFADCKLEEPERKIETISKDLILETSFLSADIVQKREIIPNTIVEKFLVDIPAENLGNDNLMDFKDSSKEHVLGKRLLPEPNVSCECPTKKILSLPENGNEVSKNTFCSFSAASDSNNKVNEDMCEDLLTDSQLVKDMKTSDFSSFENSDSPEKVQPVTENMETPNLFEPNNCIMETKPIGGKVVELNSVHCSHDTNQLISFDNPKESEDNETPNLLEHCDKSMMYLDNHNACDKDDLNCIPETSAIECDKIRLKIDESEALYDDAMTADIDFESTSLEVADTLEDLLTKSNNGSVSNHAKPATLSNGHTSIDVLELNPQEYEVFTIPETVLLETKPEISDNDKRNLAETKDQSPDYQPTVFGNDVSIEKSKTGSRFQPKPSSRLESKISSWLVSKELQSTSACNTDVACDYFEETQCDSLDQLQTIQDTVFLNAEDSLALGNYRDIPFMEKEVKKKSSSDMEEISAEDQDAIIKLSCSLQGDIDEPVNDIKMVTFNNSSYVFIQHITWIQVWKQEESKDWIKIFSHQVDDKLQLKEICFTKDCKHLVLVMLLCGDQVHCLQFLLFESEARVIKLMEHTHWMHSRCPEETVLLCGLEDLKFATAQGKDHFEVFVHIFSSLDDHPRLAMVTLGSTPGLLHSLCRIEKLPNALMGTTHSTLYVWHLLEARLVTSVLLQLPDQLTIEKCIWATIESGLVFFMTVCRGKDDFQSCQLLATNLATGFCQTAMSYSFMPSKEMQYVTNKNLKAVYNEPFLAVSSEDGCFLWSVSEEYCCAALGSKSCVTAVNIGNDREDKLLVAVGHVSGCVNCYSLKCP